VNHQLNHQLPTSDDMMILCSGSNRIKLGRHRFHRHYFQVYEIILLSAVLSEIYILKFNYPQSYERRLDMVSFSRNTVYLSKFTALSYVTSCWKVASS